MKKYLISIIGEILLIVIGILIALQIDNWNQHNSFDRDLQASFQKLLLDLNDDEKDFDRIDSIYNERMKAAESLQLLLSRKNEISDIYTIRNTIKLGNRALFYNKGTYSTLINSGLLYKIENEKISSSIHEYYTVLESYVKVFDKLGNTMVDMRDQEMLIPFRYIRMSPDTIFTSSTKALTWMNDQENPTYQATQTYLAVYLSQNNLVKYLLSNSIKQNRLLQQILTSYMESQKEQVWLF